MRIIVLGGDGYLGWPTAMHLAAKGHEVWTIDNYLRRQIALETSSEALIPTPNLNDRARIYQELTGRRIQVTVGDCTERSVMDRLFAEARPDAVICPDPTSRTVDDEQFCSRSACRMNSWSRAFTRTGSTS